MLDVRLMFSAPAPVATAVPPCGLQSCVNDDAMVTVVTDGAIVIVKFAGT